MPILFLYIGVAFLSGVFISIGCELAVAFSGGELKDKEGAKNLRVFLFCMAALFLLTALSINLVS